MQPGYHEAMKFKALFRKHVAIPQDHGSWVFLIAPLAIGLFTGGTLRLGSGFLALAALAGFLLRQPVTILVKVGSGRRPRSDLGAASFWTAIYGLAGLLAALGLVWLGHAVVLWLVLPGVPVFAWHLVLVSRREERHQAGVEILGAGVLALTAPAAFWVGNGSYDPRGWLLWALTWLQSAASIVYATLRLAQRTWPVLPDRSARFRLGGRALVYTTFNVLVVAAAGIGLRALPRWIFLPFLLQWLETLWGIEHPALGWRPFRIGSRQLIVSLLFTVLFILLWR